jgi:hypothetical protein
VRSEQKDLLWQAQRDQRARATGKRVLPFGAEDFIWIQSLERNRAFSDLQEAYESLSKSIDLHRLSQRQVRLELAIWLRLHQRIQPSSTTYWRFLKTKSVS